MKTDTIHRIELCFDPHLDCYISDDDEYGVEICKEATWAYLYRDASDFPDYIKLEVCEEHPDNGNPWYAVSLDDDDLWIGADLAGRLERYPAQQRVLIYRSLVEWIEGIIPDPSRPFWIRLEEVS